MSRGRITVVHACYVRRRMLDAAYNGQYDVYVEVVCPKCKEVDSIHVEPNFKEMAHQRVVSGEACDQYWVATQGYKWMAKTVRCPTVFFCQTYACGSKFEIGAMDLENLDPCPPICKCFPFTDSYNILGKQSEETFTHTVSGWFVFPRDRNVFGKSEPRRPSKGHKHEWAASEFSLTDSHGQELECWPPQPSSRHAHVHQM